MTNKEINEIAERMAETATFYFFHTDLWRENKGIAQGIIMTLEAFGFDIRLTRIREDDYEYQIWGKRRKSALLQKTSFN